MKTFVGTVERGSIKVPPGQALPEGACVVVAVVEEDRQGELTLPLEIEDEDLAFVRACRGRLARQLQAETG